MGQYYYFQVPTLEFESQQGPIGQCRQSPSDSSGAHPVMVLVNMMSYNSPIYKGAASLVVEPRQQRDGEAGDALQVGAAGWQ